MSTKTEEKFKLIIKEYIDEKQKDVSANALSILLWGFWIGVLFAYANIAPLMIGIIFGYAVAKKEVPFVDYYILKFITLINYSKKRITASNENKSIDGIINSTDK